MGNTLILFADTVEFTHMSSNKNAIQLVWCLSDLNGRLNELCVEIPCLEIETTLGDCYYCVSGCLNYEKIMENLVYEFRYD
jgi:hypothetical protein